MGGFLQLIVQQGHNFRGSDVYLSLHLDGEVLYTHRNQCCSYANWQQHFTLQYNAKRSSNSLHVRAYECSWIGEDRLIGSTTVDLANLLPHKAVNKACFLDASPDDGREQILLMQMAWNPSQTSQLSDEYGFPVSQGDTIHAVRARGKNRISSAIQKEKWGEFIRKHPQQVLEKGTPANRLASHKIQELVNDGIPVEYRCHVWSSLSGARERMLAQRQYYTSLIAAVEGSDTEYTKQIDKDLCRTFPNHQSVAAMKPRLRTLLAALSVHSPKVGYCQGLSYVGAIMLLLMEEECAFWMLAELVDHILPTYYTPDLMGITADEKIFCTQIEAQLPDVQKRSAEEHIPLSFVGFEWFLCLYTRTLPTETALRVWDCLFLSRSSSTLLNAGIGMLMLEEDRILDSKVDFFETVQSLGRPLFDANRFMKEVFLVQEGEVELYIQAQPSRCLPALTGSPTFARRVMSEVVVYAQQQNIFKQSSCQRVESSTRAAKVYHFPSRTPDVLMYSQLGSLQA